MALTVLPDNDKDGIADEDDLDAVALGRVFTGKKASELELTLVDKLGGLHEAIEVAKNSASIEGEVEIVEFPKKMKSKNIDNIFTYVLTISYNFIYACYILIYFVIC